MLDAVRMVSGLGSVTFVLGVVVLSSCANAIAPAAPVTSASAPLVALAPPQTPFSPLKANPERKAKLLALTPRLDELFRARAAELGTTGAAVAIVLEGEVLYVRGLGVRNLEKHVPVDADTIFRVGSVSKTITALAVMRLRDQGKLALDAPAATYLPALRAVAGPTTDSPPLTVRQLLSMTSGLGYDDQWGAVTFGYSDAELARFLEQGLTFGAAPGERYQYSNLGYALLGKIIEHASGKAFSDYVATDVFGPLGMTSSGYVTGALPVERLATGYYRDGERLVTEPVPSDGVFAPAGGVYTSIRDLARYAAFQLAAYPPRNDPETGAVRRSTLREMHAGWAWQRGDDLPVVKRAADGSSSLTAASYGLGWSLNTTCGFEAMVQHGGFEPGYFASIRLVPRHGFGVVMLSTTAPIGQLRTFELLTTVLRDGGVVTPSAASPSRELLAARDTSIRLLTAWDAQLVAGAFDPLTLRYSFFRNFRADMERMGREHGRCRAAEEMTALSRSHARFRLECERGAIEFIVFLTPGVPPKIQMFEWHRELPVTTQDEAAASKLVVSIRRDATLPPDLLAPQADRSALEKRLARLHGTYGTCEIDKPLWNNAQGEAAFRLRCADSPLDLAFRLDAKTGRVLDFSGTQPRTFGAICIE
jgi:CubicO group peptidase (beta-lactamase class C family)